MTINPWSAGSPLPVSLLRGIANAPGGFGVVSGCGLTKGTGDWAVDVASGTALVSNSAVTVGSTTKTLTDPASDADLDSGEFRVDLISVDSGGTVSVTEGTAAAKPTEEDIPASETLLGYVLVSGDASALTSGDIYSFGIPVTAPVNAFSDLSTLTAYRTYSSTIEDWSTDLTNFSGDTGSFQRLSFNGPGVTTVGHGDGNVQRIGDADNGPSRGDTFVCWMCPKEGDVEFMYGLSGIAPRNFYQIGLDSSGSFYLREYTADSSSGLISEPLNTVAAMWYEVEVEWTNGDDHNVTIRDLFGNLIHEATANDATHAAEDGYGFEVNNGEGLFGLYAVV